MQSKKWRVLVGLFMLMLMIGAGKMIMADADAAKNKQSTALWTSDSENVQPTSGSAITACLLYTSPSPRD